MNLAFFKISNIGLEPKDSIIIQKHIRLSNQLSASFAVIMFIAVCIYAYLGIYRLVGVLFGLNILVAIVLGLNKIRWFDSARVLLIFSANFGTLIFQWILGEGSLVKLFSIVFLALPFILFSKKRLLMAFGVLISFSAILLSFYTKLDTIYVKLPEYVVPYLNLYWVLVVSFTLLLMIIYFARENTKAEDELKSKVRMLEEREVQLLEKNKEMGELNYMVSHDLKSPARGVRVLAGMLKEDIEEEEVELSGEIMGVLDTLVNRAQRMEDLIRDILDYGRAGKVHENEVVNIVELITEITELLVVPKTAKLDIDPNLPPAYATRVGVGQIFQNLITNALKYGDSEKPIIKIGAVEKDGKNVYFVKDNGTGIDPKYHKKIFEMFQVLQRTKNEESTGVGLAIVKKIIEGMNCKIWVVSELGKGAEFWFTLPRGPLRL